MSSFLTNTARGVGLIFNALLVTACGGGGDGPVSMAAAIAVGGVAQSAEAGTPDIASFADATQAAGAPGADADSISLAGANSDALIQAQAAPSSRGEPVQSAAIGGKASVIVLAPAPVAADPSPAKPALPAIDPQDIIVDANADVPLEKQQWYFECNGVSRHAESLASQSLPAQPNALYSAMSRIAVTTPTGSAEKGIVLRTAYNDPITSGSPRCELTFTAHARSFLPAATDFWQANRIWVEGWPQAKDMQLVYQWHDTDFPLALNPPMALVVQGDKAFLQVRWETSGRTTTSRATIVTKDIWTGPASTFTGRWATIVVRARVSASISDNPFLQFWIDGKLLANYSGPLGYIQPGKPLYGKIGYYHWLNDNAWDPRYPLRSVYVHRAVTVLDAGRRYKESQLSSFVQ